MMLLTEKKHKKKKPISAMAQVGNKVNAGIMDAVTCCGMCESKETNNVDTEMYKKYLLSILNFMENNGAKVKPFPKIILNNEEQEGIFISTGYYRPDEKSVTIFINNRNIKDILRSATHEFWHHHQNLTNMDLNFNTTNVKDNQTLEKVEADAYLNGNIYFRKWTEFEKEKKNSNLNESVDNSIYSKKSEEKLRKTLKDLCDSGRIPCSNDDYVEMAEFYRTIIDKAYGDGFFDELFSDNDAMIILTSIIDDEYEKLGGKTDLSDEPNHRKSIDKGLKKLDKKRLNEGRKKITKNDKGEIVPDKCPECGSDIGLYIKGEPIYQCSNKKCGKYFGTMPCHLHEINANNIDLSSFKIKKELNPKFWIDGHLDSRIRMKLLDLADDFIKELDINWVEPKDIIMTGSLANYNWDKKYSDIDLHILVNFKDVDENIDFVSNYFHAKKKEWNEEHKDLNIFGFTVEVYVQDINEKLNAGGVYSLEKDKWIDEPDREDLASYKNNNAYIKGKVAEYINNIDELEKDFEKNKDDSHKIEVINRKSEKLFDEIKAERKKGFEKSENEMNDGNLIFKSLRRLDYIKKIIDLKSKTYNIINSLS